MLIGASRKVGHFFNAIHHHDGCRLVHPAKWDIGQFRGAFVTDADWCIPSCGSFCISFNSRCQELTDSFTIRFIIHIHMYLFHIYLVKYQNTLNKNRVREQTQKVLHFDSNSQNLNLSLAFPPRKPLLEFVETPRFRSLLAALVTRKDFPSCFAGDLWSDRRKI